MLRMFSRGSKGKYGISNPLKESTTLNTSPGIQKNLSTSD